MNVSPHGTIVTGTGGPEREPGGAGLELREVRLVVRQPHEPAVLRHPVLGIDGLDRIAVERARVRALALLRPVALHHVEHLAICHGLDADPRERFGERLAHEDAQLPYIGDTVGDERPRLADLRQLHEHGRIEQRGQQLAAPVARVRLAAQLVDRGAQLAVALHLAKHVRCARPARDRRPVPHLERAPRGRRRRIALRERREVARRDVLAGDHRDVIAVVVLALVVVLDRDLVHRRDRIDDAPGIDERALERRDERPPEHVHRRPVLDERAAAEREVCRGPRVDRARSRPRARAR
jgi:hypothetical protein